MTDVSHQSIIASPGDPGPRGEPDPDGSLRQTSSSHWKVDGSVLEHGLEEALHQSGLLLVRQSRLHGGLRPACRPVFRSPRASERLLWPGSLARLCRGTDAGPGLDRFHAGEALCPQNERKTECWLGSLL